MQCFQSPENSALCASGARWRESASEMPLLSAEMSPALLSRVPLTLRRVWPAYCVPYFSLTQSVSFANNFLLTCRKCSTSRDWAGSHILYRRFQHGACIIRKQIHGEVLLQSEYIVADSEHIPNFRLQRRWH